MIMEDMTQCIPNTIRINTQELGEIWKVKNNKIPQNSEQYTTGTFILIMVMTKTL